MSFKDQIAADLAVFLNLDEFAERRRIEGVEIAVVVDEDHLNKLKQGQILGLVEADMLLFGRETDFPPHLDPGRLLNVDGREMIVENAGSAMGLVEVALRQNRNG